MKKRFMRYDWVFLAMMVLCGVLEVVSGIYPDAFMTGVRVALVLAAAVCSVLSFIDTFKRLKREKEGKGNAKVVDF